MRLISFRLVLIALVTVLFAGCLTVDKKDYYYKTNSDGSGEGWIKFYNIKSAKDGEDDVSLKDFAELKLQPGQATPPNTRPLKGTWKADGLDYEFELEGGTEKRAAKFEGRHLIMAGEGVSIAFTKED